MLTFGGFLVRVRPGTPGTVTDPQEGAQSPSKAAPPFGGEGLQGRGRKGAKGGRRTSPGTRLMPGSVMSMVRSVFRTEMAVFGFVCRHLIHGRGRRGVGVRSGVGAGSGPVCLKN